MKLSENDWLFINRILLKMYASNAEHLFDKDLMRNLSLLIPYDKASFFLHDHEGEKLLHRPLGINFVKEDLEQYSPRFAKELPHIWVNFYDQSVVVRDSDIYSDGAEVSTPYYTALLLDHNIKYALTLSLAHEGVRVGVLTLFRKTENQDFTDREVYMAEQLVEHIASYAYQIYDLQQYGREHRLQAPGITEIAERYGLSSRELDVLRLLSDGKNTREISEALYIAKTTIKKHLSSIYGKMGIKNKSELIRILSPSLLEV